jgi:uncharacterized membrane protein
MAPVDVYLACVLVFIFLVSCLFVVFGVWVKTYVWGYVVVGVWAGSFENMGDSLRLYIGGVLSPEPWVTSPSPYPSSIALAQHASNCAPVTPMPSATISNSFELSLYIQENSSLMRTYLAGGGEASRLLYPYYATYIGPQWKDFEIRIWSGYVLLRHHNDIAPFPMPAPVSSLV